MTPLSRRTLLQTGLGALAGSAAGDTHPAAEPLRAARHDHILGTSFDLWIAGTAAELDSAEALALDEIARLRQVFSPFDPASEAARLSRAAGPMEISADLAAVLRAYERFQALSGGACNPQLGGLAARWAEAQRQGVPPSAEELASFAAALREPAWRFVGERTVVRTHRQPLDLCSLAKGYVIGRAVEAIRQRHGALPTALVDLGGDLGGWGEWLVAVQDPFRPHEHAAPLALLRVKDRAVATSGGYQRGHVVAGVRHSHLLDPRTGRPADGIASATVVAESSLVANALATALCVLAPEDGLRLAALLGGAECLIVAADGETFRSPGLAEFELVPAAFDDGAKPAGKAPAPKQDAPAPAAGVGWLAGHQVTIALEIPAVAAKRRYRRPYVAVWIEDANKKPVRTLTVWGNSSRWLPTMSGWWALGRGNAALVKAVTRATRAPGKYAVVWDGKDDKGVLQPQGTYTVKVEVHREHGQHLFQTGQIECGAQAAKLTLEANAETGATVVEYGFGA